jgi:solute carrier family 25 uncoupling protein 27
MQADVRAVMSGQQQHRHFSSIRSVAAALIQQHGVAGLWRGGLPAVQRAALVNLGELSTYDSVSV